MAKESFYFTHDYGSRNDPKLQKVLMKLGHEGKSVYWDLIEMLYEEGGYLLLDECENYAFALRTNKECIQSLIDGFDLFEKNHINFWSVSALKRLDRRDAKSKKASESAKTRWNKANALKDYANASKSYAIKEIKGEESKEETNVGLPTSTPTKVVLNDSDKCELFIKSFNSKKIVNGKNSKYQSTSKVCSALRKRLKTYTSKQIFQALSLAMKEDYNIKSNFKYLTPEYMLRETVLERYLNTEEGSEQPNQNVYTPMTNKIDHSNRD